MSGNDDGFDPQHDPLTGWLTQLAEDPDAPPSSVSALSVIAAARAEAKVSPAENDADVGSSTAATTPVSPAAHPRSRPNRRRIFLGGLVAAASLAAIAAVVIPVTLSGSSSNTSADSARVASATSAAMAEQSGAALLPAPDPSQAGDAAGGQAESPAAAEGAAPETGRADAGAAEDSLATAASTCWPALSPEATDALLAALPPGQFRDQVPLTTDCGPAPVGGAVLAGAEPGTVLVVRISGAEPGACVTDTAVAEQCEPQGGEVYLATDDSGAATAVVYGNGLEVAIGGWPAVGDSVAIGSGLTNDQLVAAAQAVLGALS